MDLFSLLACPRCKTAVDRADDALRCGSCGRAYPIVDGVPVLLPDGSVPETVYQHQLELRTTYDPWIHRVVLQSLPPSAVVLEIGAGNMALDLSNVLRMDVTLTPYVDVVGDAHALPFLPDVFDFVFSLAVVEHLREPFVAAQETYRVLRRGGYTYQECNFVFPYHGYPFHFFNASEQGMREVFAAFRLLRSGVAPYQMPSFALRAVVDSYCTALDGKDDRGVAEVKLLLQQLLGHPLGSYDRFFDEELALRTAAGTYFWGYKLEDGRSDVIPGPIQEAWSASPALQARFPDPLDLGRADNVLRWAAGEGGVDPAIAAGLDAAPPFHKHGAAKPGVEKLRELELVDPVFKAISEPEREQALLRRLDEQAARQAHLENQIREKNEHIARLEQLIGAIEQGRINRVLRWLNRLRGKP